MYMFYLMCRVYSKYNRRVTYILLMSLLLCNRDIQDRYKLALTEDAKRQISHSANNAGLSHTVFIRTQYDVLRRLRAYWVPRFLIHKERMNELR